MSKRRRHPKNIRPWKGGYQTYGEVSGAPLPSVSWPASATTEEMQAFVAKQKAERKVVGPKRGSFAEDVQDYLSRIVAVRTYSQFVANLNEWLRVLGGDRPRRSIKASEIDRAMQQWERDGAGPATLRKRRMALLALWNRLDGKDAPNPVRAARNPPPHKPEARHIAYPLIKQALAAMPERTPKQRASKRRVTVVAYTGIPQQTLERITPADLDLDAGTIRLVPRRKGHGVEAVTLPLIPDALAAFRAFHEANDYGPYRKDSAQRQFKLACRAVGLPGATLYDLRHSFATALYRATKDLETVARFLQHSTTALTRRYAKGAMGDVDRAAAKALGRSLSPKPVPPPKSSMKKKK